MPELVIRPFGHGDAPQIVALVTGIQRDEFNVPVTAEEQPDLLEPITFFRHGAGDFWVAADGERIVGTIGLLDIGERIGVLRKMFLAREYRGAKIGAAKQLLDTLLASARGHHLCAVYLGTAEILHAAHRFYEKNGFSEIPVSGLPAAFPRMAVDTKFYCLTID